MQLQRATGKDLLNFTQELGSLLEAGLPIDRALYVLSEHSEKAIFKEMLSQIYLDIQKGQSLSQAMNRHPRVFPKVYVNMIKAGEAGGILEQVIKRLAGFLETSSSFRDEIISALIYPALLVVVGGAAVAMLVLFVIPRFAGIFHDMGESLPLPTLILMDTSEFMIKYWWAALIAVAVLLVLGLTYAKSNEGRLLLDRVKLKIPLVRSLNMKFTAARFTRTLGTLLQSGVPVLQAVSISREVLGNEVMSGRLKSLEEGIKKGRGVAGPLKESGVFPATVSEMIMVGEEAGHLEETFLLIAERFEAESRSSLKRIISLLEPGLILVMGLIVGFIVVSMLLAVFSINDLPL
jgi:general secretion pathway protein F